MSSSTLAVESPALEKASGAQQGQLSNLPASPTPQTPPFRSILWENLVAPVRPTTFVEIELLLLTFCTGIQDAISFPDYHCFTSNQTGNTVFLMLAIILPELNGETFVTSNIGVALGLFLSAGWLTGQAALVFAAAGIQYAYPDEDRGPRALAVIALLAFASGSQVIQSRSFAMTEISTAMATAAWVDLVMDRKLFAFDNRGRTRRVAFLIILALGALVGAGIYKTAGSATAIAVSAAGKLVVTIMYFFNSAERQKEDTSAEDSV